MFVSTRDQRSHRRHKAHGSRRLTSSSRISLASGITSTSSGSGGSLATVTQESFSTSQRELPRRRRRKDTEHRPASDAKPNTSMGAVTCGPIADSGSVDVFAYLKHTSPDKEVATGQRRSRSHQSCLPVEAKDESDQVDNQSTSSQRSDSGISMGESVRDGTQPDKFRRTPLGVVEEDGGKSPEEVSPECNLTRVPFSWQKPIYHSNGQHGSFRPESGHIHHDQPLKPKYVKQNPGSSQQTVDDGSACLSGYNLLASKLSMPKGKDEILPPLYRKFSQLQHRILLQLQDELVEMEHDLANLDQIDAIRRSQSRGKLIPDSRRFEGQWRDPELHARRLDLLGRICMKVEQYNKVVITMASVRQGTTTPSMDEVSQYRTWLAENAPLSQSEMRFLDNADDIMSLTHTTTQFSPHSDHSERTYAQMQLLTGVAMLIAASSSFVVPTRFWVKTTQLGSLFLGATFLESAIKRIAFHSKVAPDRQHQCAASGLWSQPDTVSLRKTLKDEHKAKRQDALAGKQAPPSCPSDDRLRNWELTVGIEIHAQLNTARKLFSYASTAPTDTPNRHIAEFDLSVPGSLPIFQKATLIPALRAAISLNCKIQPVSRFDRKHYFYHDQPAGYQITQYYEPFARDGSITLGVQDGVAEDVTVGIKQIQMEQDTARTQDQDEEISLIDYNRAGQPLIEIISLPHIHLPEVASAYVRKVQAILFAVNAVTTGMEMGGLRADVNVSVRRKDAAPGVHSYSGVSGLGQRTEIKNLSSFKGVEDAIKAERDRQIDVLEAGGVIEGETRGWSTTRPGETRRLRGKEGEVDYRYMPDPDISPLRIGDDVVQYLTETLPAVPDKLLEKLTDGARYGLSTTDAKILLAIDDGERVDYFEEVVDELYLLQHPQAGAADDAAPGHVKARVTPQNGRLAANWVLQELGSLISTTETAWPENKVSASTLASIMHQSSEGRITTSSAKQILKNVFEGDTRAVDQIVKEDGLEFKALSHDEYTSLANEVIDANKKQVNEIREKGERAKGKIMFLVGQMLRRGEQGRVEAVKCEGILRAMLLPKHGGQ